MSWKLDNAEAREKKNPDSFEIPPKMIRESLIPGDFAKLIFLQKNPEAGERMWVEVSKSLGKGHYQGVLANHPALIDDVEYGDVIEFEAKHVADVESHSSNSRPNFTMNGISDAFEIYRSNAPAREVVADESDMWFFAAPEAVKARSRGRGRGASSPLQRPERPGIERQEYGPYPEPSPGREGSPFGASRFSRRLPPREGFARRDFPPRDYRE